MIDNETRQWIIALISVTVAPVLTYFIALKRMRWLGLNKDNVLIINERAEFRKDQIDRAKAQDAKIEALEKKTELFRQQNNRLYGRVMYLEALMHAKGIEFIPDEKIRIID